MKQRNLAIWLKVILIGMAVCGAGVYGYLIPSWGKDLATSLPEYADCYWPWLVFIWITGIPCYATLVFGWRIAGRIGQDQSFTRKNASALKWISFLAAGDSVFVAVGNLVLLFLNMSHPGIALLWMIVVFIGISLSVAAAALSHLVRKAAALQEEADLTI